MQVHLCGNTSAGVYSNMTPFNGKLYKEYLDHLQFRYKSEVVMFDDNGDPPGHYDVMNFQLQDNSSMDYVKIGSWHNGTLSLHRRVEHHPLSSVYGAVFESVCSKECGIGQYRHYQDGGECCWTC